VPVKFWKSSGSECYELSADHCVSMFSSVSESMAIPMATMEFAALCLDNALLLLPDPPAAASSATSDGSSEQRFVSVGG